MKPHLIALLLMSLSLALSLPAQPVAQPLQADPQLYEVSFLYSHDENTSLPASVHIAGEFNNWSTTATPMLLTTGSVFAARNVLPRGEHAYKYIINGNQWVQDTANPHWTDDGVGGRNSLVSVGVEPSVENSEPGLPQSIKAEPLGDGKYRVTFTHEAPGAKKVYLAGQFNHWNPEKDVMEAMGNGVFSITTVLEEGEIPYKFVVDGNWRQDPLNPEGADDNNSGLNSILRLGSAAQVRVSSEKKGDDFIFTEGLKHRPEDILFLNPMQDETVVVKLQAMANDLQGAWLAAANDGTTSAVYPMSTEYSDERVEMFRAKVPIARLSNETTGAAKTAQVQYSIQVADGATTVILANDGPVTAPLLGAPAAEPFTRRINPEDIFVTPEWARHVVWYQIFPERFRNGSTDNDPRTSRTKLKAWTSDWWDRDEDEAGSALEPGVFGRRYGGDIQGIMEKLPYLKALGVGAIYLNPVFEAESLHKYEATDYRHIDDNFGFAGDYAAAVSQEDLLDPATWTFTKTDLLFLEFIRKAHGAGIKVIIDGVFNHTGTEHPAFVDLQENGKQSRFSDWYSVTSWDPFEYEGWAGYDGLPEFKEDENGFAADSLKQHLLTITRRWMDPNGDGDPSDGIDGWRLDVPNEVSSSWWREWRDYVKAINPDAIIIGEIWDPPAKWLRGDQFDSVMNYQMAQALTRFFTNGGRATDLKQDLAKLLSSVPDQSSFVMMNLMNSHDTDRLVSQLNNPGRGYDAKNRQQELQAGEYSSDKPAPGVYHRMKQLTAVQFSLVGSPMIYYGDEAGMWGADDPEDRKPMLWQDLEPYEKPEENHFMADMHAHFQRCAAIRNTLPALRNGDYTALIADDAARLFGFRRHTDDQAVIVVTNDSDDVRELKIPVEDTGSDGRHYVDLLNDSSIEIVHGTTDNEAATRIEIGEVTKLRVAGGTLAVTLQPRTSAILLEVR